MSQFYLKTNAISEPMINKWYAWPMLISPATAALITQNFHINIMQSYLKMPKMHAAAAKNAKMRGGPFMDFNGEDKTEEISNCLTSIQNDCAQIIDFAKAITELNQLIEQHADGHSLIPLYDKIPDILKGYIELVYDANHQPSYRLLESLLYRSPYYNEVGQELMLSLVNGDDRPFVLSTPRIDIQDKLVWKIPFSHPAIDEFFSWREHGVSKERLEEFYQLHFANQGICRDLFLTLFTEERAISASVSRRYTGESVRIRYFGHACVLIESSNTTILIDCLISYGYKTDLPRFTFDDLPEKIDYVILTHAHQDHVLLEHLLQLRYKVSNIVVPKNISGAIQDPSLKLMFKKLNFKNVIELDELDTIHYLDGSITGIPFFGEHGDLNISSKLAYVIDLKGKKMLFAADSNNIEPKLYEHLKKEIPFLDVIFLGMECDGAPMSWLYGALLMKPLSRPMDQSRRLDGSDCEKALDIIKRFDCPEIYVYAMGKEPWLSYITSIEYTEESRPLIESNRLLDICLSENRKAERPYISKEILLV